MQVPSFHPQPTSRHPLESLYCHHFQYPSHSLLRLLRSWGSRGSVLEGAGDGGLKGLDGHCQVKNVPILAWGLASL